MGTWRRLLSSARGHSSWCPEYGYERAGCGIIPRTDTPFETLRSSTRNSLPRGEESGRDCVSGAGAGAGSMKSRTKWILGLGLVVVVGAGVAARVSNKDR